jgi:hypothetical protein
VPLHFTRLENASTFCGSTVKISTPRDFEQESGFRVNRRKTHESQVGGTKKVQISSSPTPTVSMRVKLLASSRATTIFLLNLVAKNRSERHYRGRKLQSASVASSIAGVRLARERHLNLRRSRLSSNTPEFPISWFR